MPRTFSVTYDLVTAASASESDLAQSGFLGQALGLREAVEHLSACGGAIEANVCPLGDGSNIRWFTAYPHSVAVDGSSLTRSLHLPKSVTRTSALRIARLLGCYNRVKS